MCIANDHTLKKKTNTNEMSFHIPIRFIQKHYSNIKIGSIEWNVLNPQGALSRHRSIRRQHISTVLKLKINVNVIDLSA